MKRPGDEPLPLALTRAEVGLIRTLTRVAIKRQAKKDRSLQAKFGDEARFASGRAAALRSLYDKAHEALERSDDGQEGTDPRVG